jgi:hypothetical protein
MTMRIVDYPMSFPGEGPFIETGISFFSLIPVRVCRTRELLDQYIAERAGRNTAHKANGYSPLHDHDISDESRDAIVAAAQLIA